MLPAPPMFYIGTFVVFGHPPLDICKGKHVNMQEKLALATSVGHAPAITSWHINSAAIQLICSVGSVAVTNYYIYHQSAVNVE